LSYTDIEAMWFGSPGSGSALTDAQKAGDSQYSTGGHETIQSIFNSTTCFDLMRNSSKLVLFENTIPFQLAFLALVEHDTDVAPIWDPEKRTFIALLTARDFIFTLYRRLLNATDNTVTSAVTLPISEILVLEDPIFVHNDFNSMDAEDSVHQLCASLGRLDAEYVPVVDPDEGSLVAILGYMDILHLLVQMAQRMPTMFSTSIHAASIGRVRAVPTASRTSTLSEVLAVMDDRDMNCIPVTDAAGKVVGLYQLSDVAYISKQITAETGAINFDEYLIGDILDVQQQSNGASPLYSCTCTLQDSLKTVIEKMVNGRLTRLVCVDASGCCIGILGVKEVISYIFPDDSPM